MRQRPSPAEGVDVTEPNTNTMMEILQKAGFKQDPRTRIWTGQGRDDGVSIALQESVTHIARIVAEASDVSSLSVEIRRACTDPFTQYHLSAMRANVLRHYESLLNGCILEVGAGCGAVTRYLGELEATTVVAFEHDPSLAAVARDRTRNLSNVEVVAGNWMRFNPVAQFDAVVIPDADGHVLAGSRVRGGWEDLVRKAHSLLKPDGVLIFAFENQLGLKYLAGTPHGLSNGMIEGPESVSVVADRVAWNRLTSEEILREAGFESVVMAAPFPDHRVASSIVTAEGFRRSDFDASAFAIQTARRDVISSGAPSTQLELAWRSAFENQIGLELANSLIVVASKGRGPYRASGVLAEHYTIDRIPAFCKRIVFEASEEGAVAVRYKPLAVSSHASESDQGLLRFVCPETAEYVFGVPLSWTFIRALSADNWTLSDVAQSLRVYIDSLRTLISEKGAAADLSSPYELLPGEFFDATPNNIIVTKSGAAKLIDEEWTLVQGIELGHLLMRSALGILSGISRLGRSSEGATLSRFEFVDGLLRSVGIKPESLDYSRYIELEARIQEQVTGLPAAVFNDWRPDEPLPVPAEQSEDQTRKVESDLHAEQSKTLSLERALLLNYNVLQRTSAALQAQRDASSALQNRLQEADARAEQIQRQFDIVSAELVSIRQSTSWRAVARIRGVFDGMPPGPRRAVRKVIKALWWAMTPHRIPERLRVLKSRRAAVPGADDSGSQFQSADQLSQDQNIAAEPVVSSIPGEGIRPRATAPTEEEWRDVIATYRCCPAPVVDVLVPVYGGYDETMRCIYSVLTSQVTTQYNLLIVNDASPEPAITRKLEELAACGLFELHRLEVNQGFVGACNFGMSRHPDRDVVLLNSDTEVYGDWLDRIIAAAYREPMIATVTPLSNNAEICSYPRFIEDNWIPLELPDRDLDSLAAKVNAGVVVDVPTGVGFCMFVSRVCLNEIGLLDLETFGKGYGEENDLCRRAADHGWRNILVADVFVRHYGAVSFAASKLERVRHAVETVERLHPGYLGMVHDFIAVDPVLDFRRALDAARVRRHTENGAILFVLHNWGGGTETHVQDLRALLKRQGVATVLCKVQPDAPDKVDLVFEACPETPNLTGFSMKRDLQAFAATLMDMNVRHIHIHHLAGYDDRAPDFFRLVARQCGIRYDVTVHDYMAFCPRINLVDDSGVYCGEPAPGGCEACIARNGSPFGQPSVWAWRDTYRRLFDNARCLYVPDVDVKHRMARQFPGLDFIVRPHPHVDLDRPTEAVLSTPRPTFPRKENVVRVALLGAIGPHKGSKLVEDVVRAAKNEAVPIEFVVVGYSDRDASLSELGVMLTGKYDRSDEVALLRAVEPDMVWFSSVWPETYSYTLSAAFAAKIFPVAFDMGAIATRIRAMRWGELLPLELMTDPLRLARTLVETKPTPAPDDMPSDISGANGLGQNHLLSEYYGMPRL